MRVCLVAPPIGLAQSAASRVDVQDCRIRDILTFGLPLDTYMIVSFLRQFVYLGPPKTASTSLHHWLSEPPLCETRWDSARGGQHDSAIPSDATAFFTFASVRNPYSRAVSLWRHSVKDGQHAKPPIPLMSFEEFIAWMPTAPRFYRASQSEIIAGAKLDAVVKIERIEDVIELPPIAPLRHQLPALPHLNRTGYDGWWNYYQPALAHAVRAHFAPDFQRFGYPPFPVHDCDASNWAPVPRAPPART